MTLPEYVSYELPLHEPDQDSKSGKGTVPEAGVDEAILRKNVLWYCQLRWIVIVIFALGGVLTYIPGFSASFEIQEGITWPFVASAILLGANLLFLLHIGILSSAKSLRGWWFDLWAQIVLDLGILTFVVYRAGRVETAAEFVYLFHIVLSCIFLPQWHSLAVTVLACGMYGLSAALESAGILPPGGTVLANYGLHEYIESLPAIGLFHIVSPIVIFSVVWFLTSRLSLHERRHAAQLTETNRKLLEVQEGKVRYLLHTTHELKAPFAAIQANTQLLLKGYVGPLSDDAKEIIQRIANRSRRLAGSIQEMVQLANLHSFDVSSLPGKMSDVKELLDYCVGQIRQIAAEHQVNIKATIRPGRIYGVLEHAKMLVLNLLINAVLYSHKKGSVFLENDMDPRDGRQVVTIRDEGIGIEKEKLPKVFDEYFRTDAAAQHNKRSTGLGLAIVRNIAEMHGVGIKIESAQGRGTRVTVRLPVSNPNRASRP